MADRKQIIVDVNANLKGYKRGLKDAEKETKNFGRHIKALGGMIAAAFSVREIARFVGEVSKLAGEAEGVENAFKRIGDAALMEDLRMATRGTVSDLELMKRTVSASNLGLPVQNLAQLFEFASRRAQETGESVDYLVNSIVTGIGRKSTMILDNLGISATRLKDELGGAGLEASSTFEVAAAVARIAEEEMSKAGDAVETTKDKTEQLRSAFDNLKVSLGKLVNESIRPFSGGLTKVVQGLDKFIKRVTFIKGLGGYKGMGIVGALTQGAEIDALMNAIAASEAAAAKVERIMRVSKQGPLEKPTDRVLPTTQGDKAGTAAFFEAKALAEQREMQDLVNAGKLREIDLINETAKAEQEYRKEALDGMKSQIELSKEAGDSYMQLGETFAMVWASSIEGADTFGEAVKEGIKGTIKALIAQGLTGLISNTLATHPPPASLALAGTYAALGGALMGAVSKFAAGGIVAGPNSGDTVPIMASGGEMMLNSGQQSRLFNLINSGGSGGGHVRFEIEGRKLVGVLDNTSKYNNIVRGG